MQDSRAIPILNPPIELEGFDRAIKQIKELISKRDRDLTGLILERERYLVRIGERMALQESLNVIQSLRNELANR